MAVAPVVVCLVPIAAALLCGYVAAGGRRFFVRAHIWSLEGNDCEGK